MLGLFWVYPFWVYSRGSQRTTKADTGEGGEQELTSASSVPLGSPDQEGRECVTLTQAGGSPEAQVRVDKCKHCSQRESPLREDPERLQKRLEGAKGGHKSVNKASAM